MAKRFNTHARIDLSGQKFFRLTVLSPDGRRDGDSHLYWNCRCDCGTLARVSSNCLRTGRTKSCGCFRKEARRASRNVTHGHAVGGSSSPTYQSWADMHRRCKDTTRKNFANYGARGITVCPQWDTFESFLNDMGECPPGLTIERRDNNGDYEPANCCWATYKEQLNNRRSNKTITAFGRTLTYAQWARELGADRHTIGSRIKRGWSPEKAVSIPLRR